MSSTSPENLSLGVCDYPEHVNPDQWRIHAKQQQELGLRYVRLAEFSWARIEPSEGVFDWQWLDDAIAIYQEFGLQIVLGTPTATPPAWLIVKYPEVLPVDELGNTKGFGSRRHYDHASPIYRKRCQDIIEQMAGRYGKHPAVVGWQTDNELGHEGTAVSYGGASAELFPSWLEQKYKSLDALNVAWGTAFWSQDYSQWQQISPPNLSAVRQPNPSHVLDYQRFCSDMIIEFQQIQIDLLRNLSPGRFITHNFVIFAAEFDLYKASENLDFVAWDSYPIGMLEYFATWESEETKTEYARTGYPDLVSLNHDIYRGLKQGKDFWVMEQQCGHANWAQYNPLPAKGAVQLWTAQAWAHGASSVVYFRWRASHMAQEIMHSGLLKQDGRPDRGFAEAKSFDPEQFALELVPAKVVLLHDYNSMWAYDQQAHNQKLSYWYQFLLFYSALRSVGVDVDIIHPNDLRKREYKMVVAPALTLVNQESADVLNKTAKHTPVIFGPRTAFRTDSCLVPEHGQFQAIKELVGIELGNFDSLRPGLTQGIVSLCEDKHFSAQFWSESYELVDADAMYVYEDGPLATEVAVSKNGNVVNIGALSSTLIQRVLVDELTKAGIETVDLPKGFRLSRRGSATLVQNFNQHEVEFKGKGYAPVSFTLE